LDDRRTAVSTALTGENGAAASHEKLYNSTLPWLRWGAEGDEKREEDSAAVVGRVALSTLF